MSIATRDQVVNALKQHGDAMTVSQLAAAIEVPEWVINDLLCQMNLEGIVRPTRKRVKGGRILTHFDLKARMPEYNQKETLK
jgi:hypothetical protein